MRVVAVYKSESEEARPTEEFLRDFSRQTGREIEVMDPETKDGVAFCEAYDILMYPTLIALSDDGQMQNTWSGLPLPTISEVSYYA